MSEPSKSVPATIGEYWRTLGEKTAQIFAPTGQAQSFSELEYRSRNLAASMLTKAPQGNEHVSLLMKNELRYLEITWAAIRSGMHLSGLNWHLPDDQITATANSAGSKFVFSSTALAKTADLILCMENPLHLAVSVGGPIKGMIDYESLLEDTLEDILDDVPFYGELMFFSSGSTGTPKGIRRELTQPAHSRDYSFGALAKRVNEVSEDSICYVSTPLYHLAALGALVGALAVGATAVISDRFDAEQMLADIQRYQVTHLNLVPTMMIRIMKLPENIRARYDMTSLKSVFHGAGPCPVPVKRAMIEWLGPILTEGYGGSEMIGTTRITSEEWLLHPGSVGRRLAGGYPVILDDDGNLLPPGNVGQIFFADAPEFALVGAAKPMTRGPNDELTLGDLGWMDSDGYLYVTGRADFAINRGGVKIMPQDIEAVYCDHSKIADAVVVGAYHDDLGEVPVVIVELEHGDAPTAQLAEELLEFGHGKMSSSSRPHEVWFAISLPRAPTGKVYLKPLRDAFSGPQRLAKLERLGLIGFPSSRS